MGTPHYIASFTRYFKHHLNANAGFGVRVCVCPYALVHVHVHVQFAQSVTERRKPLSSLTNVKVCSLLC